MESASRTFSLDLYTFSEHNSVRFDSFCNIFQGFGALLQINMIVVSLNNAQNNE